MRLHQEVPGILVLGYRHAIQRGGGAVFEYPLFEAVMTDRTTAAVLDLQLGSGHFPAVILAADEAESGDAHVVEKHAVLVTAGGTAFTAGTPQIQGHNGDPGQVSGDKEPAHVLMPGRFGVCHTDSPEE